MKLRYAALATSAILGVMVSTSASAQFAKPEDAVKYRQSALTVMAAHFSRIGAMANGRVPFDAKVAQDNAEIVATVSKLPWAGFGQGTEGGRAKANIWTDNAKFKAGSDKLIADMDKLNAAAKTGNLDQIKAAFGAAGANCKACHDEYRRD
jgi:cytochrome c556